MTGLFFCLNIWIFCGYTVEVQIMTKTQKNRIAQLREQGFSYAKIAVAMGLSENSVKSFCQRNGLGGVRAPCSDLTLNLCHHCGETLLISPAHKNKKFCSSKCRAAWWNTHMDQRNTDAMKTVNCACCGKTFSCYVCRPRKYCSHNCYIEARFKGGAAK